MQQDQADTLRFLGEDANPERAKLHRRVLAYAVAHDVSYGEAYAAVQRLTPAEEGREAIAAADAVLKRSEGAPVPEMSAFREAASVMSPEERRKLVKLASRCDGSKGVRIVFG